MQTLQPKDIDLIQTMIFKSQDNVAVTLCRSLERLEEKIADTESRLYTRIAEVEDTVNSGRQDTMDMIADIKNTLDGIRKGADIINTIVK